MPFSCAFSTLSPEQVKRLHEAALTVLDRTGIAVSHSPILHLMAEAGCRVDLGEGRIRMVPELDEERCGLVPSRFVLGARDPSLALPVDGK